MSFQIKVPAHDGLPLEWGGERTIFFKKKEIKNYLSPHCVFSAFPRRQMPSNKRFETVFFHIPSLDLSPFFLLPSYPPFFSFLIAGLLFSFISLREKGGTLKKGGGGKRRGKKTEIPKPPFPPSLYPLPANVSQPAILQRLIKHVFSYFPLLSSVIIYCVRKIYESFKNLSNPIPGLMKWTAAVSSPPLFLPSPFLLFPPLGKPYFLLPLGSSSSSTPFFFFFFL